MKSTIPGIIITVMFLMACNSDKKEDARLFMMPGEWVPDDSILVKTKERIQNGAVEHFSINGTDFRFQKSQQANVYDLQANIDGKWATNLVLPLPERHAAFHLNIDLDMDGSTDLSVLKGPDMIIYFFNREKKVFDLNPVRFPYDFAHLDKTKPIYAANDKMGDDWKVQFFEVKNKQLVYTYFSRLIWRQDNPNSQSYISQGLLYKCANGDLADTTLIEKVPVNRTFGNFSLNYYMKNVARYGSAKKLDQPPQQ